MSNENTCCARSYSGESFFGHVCGKKAKVERDGKHYCGIHDPVRIKEKRDIADEKFRKRMDEEVAARRKANSEAAEQKRRAECYPDLLEALIDTLDALECWTGSDIRIEKARAAIKKATK